MSDAMKSLMAKVEAGRISTDAISAAFGNGWDDMIVLAAFDGDLNAALSLHEVVLCRDDPQYGYLVGPRYARIVHPSCGTVCDAMSQSPARAWLIAILRAKIKEASA